MVRDSSFVAYKRDSHDSWFVIRRSYDSELWGDMIHSSCFMIHGSWFVIRDSRGVWGDMMHKTMRTYGSWLTYTHTYTHTHTHTYLIQEALWLPQESAPWFIERVLSKKNCSNAALPLMFENMSVRERVYVCVCECVCVRVCVCVCVTGTTTSCRTCSVKKELL